MLTFGQFLENKVFRLDPEQHNFANHDNLGHYFFLDPEQDTTGSGRIDPNQELPDWAKGKKGAVRQGLFASNYKDVVPYMVPRDVPHVITYTSPKKTIYFKKSDIPAINNYKPWISSFHKKDFETLSSQGQEEFFNTKPFAAAQQKQINSPMNKIKAIYNVQIVDDLYTLVNQLKANNINYTAEALPDAV